VRLFHYTCEHGAARIRKAGMRLTPNPQVALGGVALVWLTNLEAPNRQALGLTSHALDCDRLDARFEVKDSSACERWVEFAYRCKIPTHRRWGLELTDGAYPMTWWVSLNDVPVRELVRA
jgi:hypothetical protein